MNSMEITDQQKVGIIPPADLLDPGSDFHTNIYLKYNEYLSVLSVLFMN